MGREFFSLFIQPFKLLLWNLCQNDGFSKIKGLYLTSRIICFSLPVVVNGQRSYEKVLWVCKECLCSKVSKYLKRMLMRSGFVSWSCNRRPSVKKLVTPDLILNSNWDLLFQPHWFLFQLKSTPFERIFRSTIHLDKNIRKWKMKPYAPLLWYLATFFFSLSHIFAQLDRF